MNKLSPPELKDALDSGATVFLKLSKDGCGACKLSESATRRLEDDDTYKDVRFIEINTSTHPEMLETAESEVLPAFYVFRDKARVGEFVGFKGLAPLKALLDEAVKG